MALPNRDLKVGTKLEARYKGQVYRAEVAAGEDGKLAYRLEDGQEFTSPSAAGSAVMGGVACNGWRFRSLEGDLPAKAEKPKREAKAKAPAKTKASAKAKVGAKAKAGKNGTGPVACGECGQEFPNSREAAEHMRDEHGSAEAQPGAKA